MDVSTDKIDELRDLQFAVVNCRRQVPKEIEILYKRHNELIAQRREQIENQIHTVDLPKFKPRRKLNIEYYHHQKNHNEALIELNARAEALKKAKEIMKSDQQFCPKNDVNF